MGYHHIKVLFKDASITSSLQQLRPDICGHSVVPGQKVVCSNPEDVQPETTFVSFKKSLNPQRKCT